MFTDDEGHASSNYHQFIDDIEMGDSDLNFRSSRKLRGGVAVGTLLVTVALVAACGIGLGFVIGWFSKGPIEEVTQDVPESYKVWLEALEETDSSEVTKMILGEIRADNIRENLR